MGDMTSFLKDWLFDTIKLIVDKPKEVEVTTSVTTKNLTFNIDVEKADRGKVIGREGATIKSLIKILTDIKRTRFMDDHRNIVIEVVEDEAYNFKKEQGEPK